MVVGAKNRFRGGATWGTDAGGGARGPEVAAVEGITIIGSMLRPGRSVVTSAGNPSVDPIPWFVLLQSGGEPLMNGFSGVLVFHVGVWFLVACVGIEQLAVPGRTVRDIT